MNELDIQYSKEIEEINEFLQLKNTMFRFKETITGGRSESDLAWLKKLHEGLKVEFADAQV